MSSKVSREMLLLPRDIGVRVAAVALLDDARGAAKALDRADDPDELHDFRVGLRRLRSWLRAFKVELSDNITRKQRRRLRDIARATNAGRDIDVQLEWLRDVTRGRSLPRKRGAQWMIRQMTDSGAEIDATLAKDFRDARDDLEARLSICSVSVRRVAQMSSLAAAIAEHLPAHSAALDRALARVATAKDDDAAHQARIAVKRLRYLIEPGVPVVTSGTALLESLKRLQDELGTLHDAQIIDRAIRRALEDGPDGRTRAGLEALGAHVTESAEGAFVSVRRNWLRGRYSRVERSVTRFATRLARL